MVDAISSSSAASTLLSSAASGATSSADLEAQISSMQDTLANETDEQKRAKIEKQLAELKAQLQAAQAAEKLKQGHAQPGDKTAAQQAPSLLSGESDKIGTSNFDEATPFGDREAWV